MYKLALIALLPYFGTCVAVSLQSAEERPCFNPPPNVVKFNQEAFGNPNSVWYHHIWSKYYLYRVVKDITRKSYDEISENEINNACVRFSAHTDPGVISVTGFNDSNAKYPIGQGNHEGSILWKESGRSNWDGEVFMTKAGDDYLVIVSCFSTNQTAFTLVSLKKTLSTRIKLEVYDHVRSLGFDAEYMYEVNVERCTRKLGIGNSKNTHLK